MVAFDAAATNDEMSADVIGRNALFRFVPNELAAKCRNLVDSYHALHGYASLPDILWHAKVRDLIKRHRELRKVFTTASKTRRAKHANDSFVVIATAIVALEVLTRDLAGWGAKFPNARQEASELLSTRPLKDRVWLVDRYLDTNRHAAIIRALDCETSER
jgi:hypothetical protein